MNSRRWMVTLSCAVLLILGIGLVLTSKSPTLAAALVSTRTPTQVPACPDIAAISGGTRHVMAIKHYRLMPNRESLTLNSPIRATLPI